MLILLLMVICAVPVAAQVEVDTEAGILFGQIITGEISNTSPRDTYSFDGRRGEVVSIDLRTIDGDLDPLLTIVDNSGQVIAWQDDSQQSRDVRIDSFRIPQTDRYFIIVGRFGYSLGTTSGEYELRIDRLGVSSASGSSLRYGDAVINTISSMQPQIFYSFRAQRGDIVNIEMQRVSGNLDPFLQVVNSNAFVIAENDDVLGSDTLDAFINGLVIEETGTYIIVATRFGQAAGDSTGSFVLSLNEADNSGFGNSLQTAIPIALGETVEGELTNRNFAQFYQFTAERNDLITITMNRADGNIDTFLTLTNAGFQTLAEDDDGGNGQNSRIDQYLIPADGLYYIIATRFEGEAGTTQGAYTLELQNLGNVFENVPEEIPRISYGTTVTGRIDDTTPEIRYAFWGVEGDIITTSMNRGDGNLDAFIQILNEDGTPIISNDDGGGGQNARIDRFRIPRTGLYFIQATRFIGAEGDSNTAGSFILVLAQRFD